MQRPEHQTLARGLTCRRVQYNRLIHRICVGITEDAASLIGYRNALYSLILVTLSGTHANPPPCLGNAAPGRDSSLQNNIVPDQQDKAVLRTRRSCSPLKLQHRVLLA